MSKSELYKNVNQIALALVTQANGTETLSNNLLIALAQAEFDGLDIQSLWASIAVTNEWSDQDAGIRGNPMPKTLANYRSLSRKAIRLGVGHQHSNLPAWKKAINAADRLSKASEEEKAPRIEAINLNELELPTWIERANALRQGMTTENIQAFDQYLHHHIEAFMNKKVKK